MKKWNFVFQNGVYTGNYMAVICVGLPRLTETET